MPLASPTPADVPGHFQRVNPLPGSEKGCGSDPPVIEYPEFCRAECRTAAQVWDRVGEERVVILRQTCLTPEDESVS